MWTVNLRMEKYENLTTRRIETNLRLYTAKKTARVKYNLDLRYGPKRFGTGESTMVVQNTLGLDYLYTVCL